MRTNMDVGRWGRDIRTGLVAQIAVCALVMAVPAAMAGRPLVTDDADPVEAGRWEMEAGAHLERHYGSHLWTLPVALAWGLAPGLEVGAGLGGHFEERTHALGRGHTTSRDVRGLGDLTAGVKWLAIERCPAGARHALASSVKFPTSDDEDQLGSGEVDGDLLWIASRSIGDGAGFHLNAGYTWIGGPDRDVVHGGAALDAQLADTLQGVGEVFLERERGREPDAVAGFTVGVRWWPAEDLVFDVAWGRGWLGDGPEWRLTVGLTWTFGGPRPAGP